ncbi:hypothetical protein CGCF415_v013107 [Colletotrichum fructicola]|uniref:Secreted in xylem 5 n=3 Tax=Colletotrichum gloeosporioides species complex TaxID=2707338 RepID=L2FMA1_COLFN|nr:uncharacterized protein CGMCC3_g5543 [Colletotrichum fructicola]XP_036491159.1 uncharacterized protein CGCS363_v012591 [Colletotrichum siamense]KAF4481055.1 hypothetical protein CGGC5_v011433 [Colletotrichum fructicola Nara gc5]KAK1849529.1 secreted in xylem 5 [Colletotrichum chrysophilum]KAE9578561.1 hypothetical protein CGMCC3_g5543 [Colletotrichum fructicola]KAF4426310.1 hypothetical protein CFRS1_v009875 [Colletotrichum fructicola]KAF4840293.1 hypothetical protein CGCSCA4_v010473 [Coll
MRLQFFAALITLLSGVLADSHDYCACQQWSNGPVDHVATAKVAARACFGYVWAPYEHLADSQTTWNANSPGPRFEGRYLQNMIKRWRIDGDDFYNRCREAGAGDSTCFGCSDLQVNSDGRVQCNEK